MPLQNEDQSTACVVVLAASISLQPLLEVYYIELLEISLSVYYILLIEGHVKRPFHFRNTVVNTLTSATPSIPPHAHVTYV